MDCPEENVVVDFVRGELSKDERAALEAHIDACETCSMVVAEMARLFIDADVSVSGRSRPPEPDLVDGVGLVDTNGAFSPTAITQSSGEILAEPAAMLPQGAKLGRYVVIDRVGAGGMGVVYAAYDPELDRKVALKVLRRAVADGPTGSQQRDRLMREAQAMAKLSHPNVITVHDVGTFEGQVFLAMEFIDGQTLGDWLRGAPPGARGRPGAATDRPAPRSWQAVLDVFAAAGRGLAAAHAVGLVHRDFKPDNVLIGRDGRVLVTDFGLARPAAGKTDAFSAVGEIPSLQVLTASLTQTGALVGTPAYMAPEQLLGTRPSPRTDQFSFCVALYEGLYGRRPFRGKSFAELASNVSSGAYAPPPRDVAVPRQVRRALFRGLATEPEQRFATMDELLAALRHDPWRRWKRWGGVVVPVGLVVGGVLAYEETRHGDDHYCDAVEERLDGVWDAERRTAMEQAFLASDRPFAADAFAATARQLDDYAARWVELQGAACRDQLRGEQPQAVLALRMHCLERGLGELRTVTELLGQADAALVEGAVDAVHGLPWLEPCEDLDALTQGMPAPADSPERRTQVIELQRKLAAATVLREANKFEEAEAMAREVLASAEALGHRPVEAEALGMLAVVLDRAGRFEDAETAYHRALSAALASGHALVMGKVSAGLVWITGGADRPLAEAERWATHGLAAIEPLGAAPDLQADLYHALAVARLNHGELDQAQAAIDAAVGALERAHGEGHSSLGFVQSTQGQLLAMRGRLDEAVAALSQARTHIEREYGEQHPYAVTVRGNLAAALAEHGDLEQALALHESTLRVRQATLDPMHPDLGAAHLNMAATLDSLGRPTEAKPHAERALAIFIAAYGEQSPELTGPLNNLANVEHAQGHLEEAVALRTRAVSVARGALGPDDPRTLRYRHALALTLAEAGRVDEALTELRAVLAAREASAGPEDPSVGETAASLADVLLSHAGAPDEAVGLAERAVRIAALAKADARDRGAARLVLARALWQATERRDRARARQMAELARKDLAGLAGATSTLALVDAWLADHPLAPSGVPSSG
jgi:tetratricopeptide (TPR) repeat protein/tRNA A-37 threonylcarbamoyl transferase component Bud32